MRVSLSVLPAISMLGVVGVAGLALLNAILSALLLNLRTIGGALLSGFVLFSRIGVTSFSLSKCLSFASLFRISLSVFSVSSGAIGTFCTMSSCSGSGPCSFRSLIGLGGLGFKF